MGRVQCPEHGRRGAVEVCPEIASAVAEGRRTTAHRVTIMDIFAPNVMLCDKCFAEWLPIGARLGTSDVEVVASDREREAFERRLRLVCDLHFEALVQVVS